MIAAGNQITELQKAFAEIGRDYIDTALRASEIWLDKSQSLLELEVETAKEALEDNRRYARELWGMKDVSDYATLRPKFTDATVQKAMSFWSRSYDIAWQAQAEVTHLARESLDRISHDVADAMAKNGSGSPVSELTMTAFKNATEVVNQTLSGMAKAVKQVSQVNAAAGARATAATRRAKT